ncbi:hypothetical protein C9374_000972 [Naegleria lovaniensis]|uniref:Ubiquitin carboxyl-terminal hydrolase n=1 Tax=Naegleria lovaniensis TaxID=51637 RepID=A0AA88KSL6_NAELO|nr:uncharacterized protein C9374_000972 [Naegleria lovaniensis]KAG2388122.1 hypothetical protein C9374_000972 [Naegleria lovaniensis]
MAPTHMYSPQRFVGSLPTSFVQQHNDEQTNTSFLSSILQYVKSSPERAVKMFTSATFWKWCLFVGGGCLLVSLLGRSKKEQLLVSRFAKQAATTKSVGQATMKRVKVYAGLRNEGATCYLNSLLQTLFHIPKFRRSVFTMMMDKEDVDSISKAMARVFYNLQKACDPIEEGHSYTGTVSTKCLIDSFGWTGNQVFEQHDIQEVARILLDDLQQKMKNTSVSKSISQLFLGKVESGIECINVDFRSSKEESFYDIQLDVKGCRNIYDSFNRYVKPEILSGQNKYHAEGYGLQDAKKYSTFTHLPKVLMLHLKRFDYTPLGTLQKVTDTYEFDDHINLTEFVKQKNGNKKDYSYSLHAVLIHKGSTVHSGHYVVAINVSEDLHSKEWYLFDDAKATKISSFEAIQANFGGFNTAYMLVYLRYDAIADIVKPISSNEIPEKLREMFRHEDNSCTIL